MGEKVEIKKEGEKTPDVGAKKEGEKTAEGGAKKEEEPITVVLKIDLHCEGCAKKVRRAVGNFDGVEKVKTDCGSSKLTLIGHVDPSSIRERVAAKTKKKVDLISPQPKKDAGTAAGDKKVEVKPVDKKPEDKKDDKPKEAVVNTAVLKMKLHCDGCAHKIKRVILKHINGVNSVATNSDKDLVTVIGTMVPKELVLYLQERLKIGVELIPPPAKEEGKKDAGIEKTEKKDAGIEKTEKKDAGAGKDSGEGSVKKVEINRMEFQGYNPQTLYAMQPMYNQRYFNQDYGVSMHPSHGQGNLGYVAQYSNGPPAPPPTYIDDQMFSDENPNGCSVM